MLILLIVVVQYPMRVLYHRMAITFTIVRGGFHEFPIISQVLRVMTQTEGNMWLPMVANSQVYIMISPCALFCGRLSLWFSLVVCACLRGGREICMGSR